MNGEEQFYRIEAYLQGELTLEERSSFEVEMANDPALSAQIIEQQRQRAAVEVLVQDELRAKLDSWRKLLQEEPLPSPNESRKFMLSRWGLAILLLVLMLLAYFLFPHPKPKRVQQSEQPPVTKPSSLDTIPSQKDNQPSVQEINTSDSTSRVLAMAEPYWEKPDFSTPNQRHLSNTNNHHLKIALELLDQNKFGTAIDSLRKSSLKSPDVNYYIGCAYYAQKKFTAAIPYLQLSAKDENYAYAPTARWYLSVSLLATGKTYEAKVQIRKVLEDPPSDKIADSARKLLAQLGILQ